MMNQSPAPSGVRKPVIYLVLMAAVVAVGVILFRSSPPKPAEAPNSLAESSPGQESSPTYQRPKPLHSVTGHAGETSEATPAAAEPASKPAPTTTLPGNPQPTPETRSLVSGLANLDFTGRSFTAADASAIKESLHRLSQTGPAGVAAIQEYLALKKDFSFDAVPGAAGQVGAGSLRQSLLDTLGRMSGPESLALSSQTLAGTTDPREIAILAQSLEKQAPGQYREAALAAARGALAEASVGRLEGQDVGPLFEVLKSMGGANAVTDFQSAATGPWKYYATIALAELPGGAGVPALQQIINDPQNSAASSRVAALQAVAQLSADHPEARNLLLEQARQGSIPSATWINVAAALAGDRFSIGSMSAEANPNIRTWHLAYGNQNYYAQPATLSPEQVQQRLGLFDQFMTVAANNPAALAALQNARNTLMSRQPAPVQQ